MSKARDDYYNFHMGCCDQAHDYITELEHELKMKDTALIIEVKKEIELKQQKAELVELLQRLTSIQTKDGWLDTMLTPYLNKYKGE